jgi:hypothetical protein
MTTTQHTPGPWNICLESAHRPELVTAHPNKNICSVWSGGSASQIEPEEWRANARLIAAAPEVLEALIILLGDSNKPEHRYQCDRINIARAAIAKAKGGAASSKENPADSITIAWHIDDVKEERPDLTKKERREVLAFCKERHDHGIGLNWEVIRLQAEHLYPKKDAIIAKAKGGVS